MSLSSGREIRSETERRFSPIPMFLRCYKLREIERRSYDFRMVAAPFCDDGISREMPKPGITHTLILCAYARYRRPMEYGLIAS